jgi:DNA polymerase-3 subunit delta
MLVKYEALEAQLKKGILPLYVVSGDEYLLVQEATDMIRVAARNQGVTERQVFTVDRSFKWEDLRLADNAISLFGDRKLIELRMPTGKPGRDGSKAIVQYISDLSPDNVTLIILPQLDWTTRKSAWVQALQKQSVFVEVNTVDVSQLGGWIATRLRRQNQQVDQACIRFLVGRVEGNLLAAWQEIQKLALLYPEGKLTEEQVRNAVLDVSRYDVFKVREAMLSKDTARFVRMMDGLKGEGTPLPLLLWVFVEEIRTLLKCREALDAGMRPADVARNQRLRGEHERLVMEALRHLDRRKLVEALQQASDIDRLVKGLDTKRGTSDAWDALTRLGLSFSDS